MKNCYPNQSCNHFTCRAFLLILTLFIALFGVSVAAQAYELNGTATGNLLNNGQAAEADGFSVYADHENGYALTVKNETQTFVADADNAQYINICGDKVYYTSIDGDAAETTLRCYDLTKKRGSVLYSVALGEGMKNLIVLNDAALFITDGNVVSYDFASEGTVTLFSGNIREFVPVNGGFVYTVNGKSELYFRNENGNAAEIASDVVSFDCDMDAVYYSNGSDGIYSVDFNGGNAVFVAEGGMNIVCTDDLYWLADNAVYSLNGRKEAAVQNDDSAMITVLGSEVLVEEEEILTMDSMNDADALVSPRGSIGTSAVSLSSLPDGDYKNWKQGSGSPWASNALGNSTIGSIGCAAVSVAILLVGSGAEKDRYLVYQSGALSSVDDARGFNPAVFVKEMTANGGFTSGGGMYWYKVSTVYKTFGTSIYDTGKSSSEFSRLSHSGQATAIKNHLAAGKYIILCVNNPKTGNTHWLAVDYATDSAIYVCDPGYKTDTTPFNIFDNYSTVTRAILFNYTGTRWDGTGNPTLPDEDWVNPFRDVDEDDWFYDYIAQVNEAGWMVGRSSTKFAPLENMTRKEFVCLAARLADADTDFSAYEKTAFADISYKQSSDKWYTQYIPWAVANNVMIGEKIGNKMYFHPNDSITREEICSVLVRLASKVNGDVSALYAKASFVDAYKISDWAENDVYKAQRAGLVCGSLDNGKLYMKPQSYATRAEVSAIFLRFTQRMPIY